VFIINFTHIFEKIEKNLRKWNFRRILLNILLRIYVYIFRILGIRTSFPDQMSNKATLAMRLRQLDCKNFPFLSALM